MLLNFIRWLKGYVFFVAVGRFPERFINLTIKNGIYIWDLNSGEKQLAGKMSLYDYFHIRTIARKARVRLKVTKRCGLPFAAQKYKPRIGAIAGLICFFAIIFIFSSFIWTVKINGLETLSYTYVESVLKDNGLYSGTYSAGLNISKIERDTIIKVDKIGWISINVQGSCATVEVKEKAVVPKSNDDEQKPCIIKAAKDGVITSIKCYKGTIKVKEGSAVIQGEQLIDSVVENKLGGFHFVHSDADIYAKTYENKKFIQPYKFNTLVQKDDTAVRSKANFMWMEFPFGWAYSKDKTQLYEYTKKSVCLNNVELPVGLTYQKSIVYENTEKTLSKEQAEQSIKKQIAVYEAFDKSNATVIKREINKSETKDALSYDIKYTYEENIAVKQYLSDEQQQGITSQYNQKHPTDPKSQNN